MIPDAPKRNVFELLSQGVATLLGPGGSESESMIVAGLVAERTSAGGTVGDMVGSSRRELQGSFPSIGQRQHHQGALPVVAAGGRCVVVRSHLAAARSGQSPCVASGKKKARPADL